MVFYKHQHSFTVSGTKFASKLQQDDACTTVLELKAFRIHTQEDGTQTRPLATSSSELEIQIKGDTNTWNLTP